MNRAYLEAKPHRPARHSEAREPLKIGLWFPGGGTNMGNECTLAAAIEGLRKPDPNVELFGISWNPHDTAKRHGIDSFPIKGRGGRVVAKTFAPTSNASIETDEAHLTSRRNNRLFRAARTLLRPLLELVYIRDTQQCLKGIDLLIFAGTGPLTDSWGGDMPFRVFLWAHLSRRCNTKVAFVSVGAGPIDGAISKRLFASALSKAAYRSFRDRDSRQIIEGLGISDSSNRVCPDLVFGLSIPESAARLAGIPQNDVVVTGIPYRKSGWWYRPSADAYDRYLDSMAEFVRWLLDQGRNVRLLGTQSKMDPVFITDLQTKLSVGDKTSGGRLTVEHTDTYEQLMNQLAQAHIVVTSRFHGVVFSYQLGIPALAISYHPKIRNLMMGFRQDDSCLEIEQITAEELKRKFLELDETRSRRSSEIQETSMRYRAQLDDQYQSLLQLGV